MAGLAGGVSLAVAAGFAISGARLAASADAKSGSDRLEINREIADRNRWTAIAGISGGVMASAGVGLLLWERLHHSGPDLPPPSLPAGD